MKNEHDTGRPHWMVIDDTDIVLEVLAALLERQGRAEVCRCHSGAEALAAFAAHPGAFTFVVTDLDMPGMNGLELCQRLHTLAPRLPILLATGGGALTETDARSLGFCGLLAKPFELTEFQRALASAGVTAGGAGPEHPLDLETTSVAA
jgi:two-component system, chemotaxis family, chemotaxis protein CheY